MHSLPAMYTIPVMYVENTPIKLKVAKQAEHRLFTTLESLSSAYIVDMLEVMQNDTKNPQYSPIAPFHPRTEMPTPSAPRKICSSSAVVLEYR